MIVIRRIFYIVGVALCSSTGLFAQRAFPTTQHPSNAPERNAEAGFIDELAQALPALAKIHVPVSWGKGADSRVKATHERASAIATWFWRRQQAKTPALIDSVRRIWHSEDASIRAVWLLDGQGLVQVASLFDPLVRNEQLVPAIRRFARASLEASTIKDRPESARQLRSVGHFLLAESAFTTGDSAAAITEWLATLRVSRTPWATTAAERLLAMPSVKADKGRWLTVLTLAYLQTMGRDKERYYRALETLYPWFAEHHSVPDDVIASPRDMPKSTVPLSLDDYLDRQFAVLYERTIAVQRATSSSDRGVVAEYKTGIVCSSCWTADRAFHAVTQRYTPSEVIVLGYHGNYPIGNRIDSLWQRLDAWYPMVYPKDEPFRGRYSAYLQASQAVDGKGNPIGGSYWVNGVGQPQTDPESSVPSEQQRYDLAVHAIDSLRQTAPKAALRLTVARRNDRVHVMVTLDSLAGSPQLKVMRLVLFEDTVRARGTTIRRVYQNVVRGVSQTEELPLGIPIPAKTGTIEYTFDLQAIHAHLKATRDPELAAWNPETKTVNTGLLEAYKRDIAQFPDPRDWEMNDERLYVVAFVQDIRTGEVYQAVRAKVPAR